MNKASAWYSARGHRYFANLTALNRETTSAYDRCAGHHVASGLTISRDFGSFQRVLPICSTCGCPFGGPKSKSWTIG
jgi:hypothetical protein